MHDEVIQCRYKSHADQGGYFNLKSMLINNLWSNKSKFKNSSMDVITMFSELFNTHF